MSRTRAALPPALCLLLLTLSVRSTAEVKDITIVYTGETHSLVTPCECVVSKDGGIARRAHALDRVRRDGFTPTLVLDAGGQFGGTAYDEYTEGPVVDRERTEVHLAACADMGYAAYAVGDEELQWGPEFLRRAAEIGAAPFLSANMGEEPAAASGVERYLITEVGGVSIGVTAATPQDLYALGDPRQGLWAQVGDPIEGVSRVVQEMRDQVDLVVVLSHLGSDRTRLLAESVPGVDIFINAHYRRPGGLIDRVGDALIGEFNLEARALSQLDLKVDGRAMAEYRLREIPLDPSVPDDPAQAQRVEEWLQRKDTIDAPRLVLDYYTAWGCGYCVEMEPQLREALRLFGEGRVELRRWHVVHFDAEAGQFYSTFGPPAIVEARRELAIQVLYGRDAVARYASLRALQPSVEADTVLQAQGLDPGAVMELAGSDEVATMLLAHADRARRFMIPGTPTLYLNNVEYESANATPALLRTLCWTLPEALRGEACAGVPECASHSDCRRPGQLGYCRDAGTGDARCEFTDPTPLDLIVVGSEDASLTSHRALVSDLGGLLPGLQPREVTYASEEGQALAELGGVQWLPAFFLPAEQLEQRPNLDQIVSGLVKTGTHYMVRPENTASGLMVGRERRPDRLDIYYRCSDAAAQESVATVLELLERAGEGAAYSLELHPALAITAEGNLAAQGGVAEIEEAARQAVIWRDHRQAMATYLRSRIEAGNSSYWDVPLRRAGLEPDEIRERATSDRALMDALYADAQVQAELGVYGECLLLYENREVADIAGQDAALAVADRIGLAPTSLTILYTGSTNGQLEACRCPGNPYGGLSRQAGALAELRDMYPASILVDSGDVFSETPEWTKFEYLQRAYAAMEYDAIAIGDQDFTYSVDVLAALIQGSPLPYVAANVAVGSAEPRSKLIERRGVRVGVVAVTSPRVFAFGDTAAPKGAEITDATEAARREIASLKPSASVIVVLFHGMLEDARRLAEDVPGIDVIVCGHEGMSLQVPDRVGDTHIVAPGRNGEWVGRITLRLDGEGRPIAAEPHLIPMDEQILESPEVAGLIAEYQERVQAGQRDLILAAATDESAQPETCGACHAEQLEQWQATSHARAAQTLRDLDREFDPDCWSCHSAAPLVPEAARLPDVTCVACHRVGPPTETGHEILEPLTVETCLTCHTEGKSPHFDEARYWPAVEH